MADLWPWLIITVIALSVGYIFGVICMNFTKALRP